MALLFQGGILRENKVWWSPLVRILCSPPTVPSVCRRQGGLQALKAGAGTAKMCCCHLSSWATESLGQVFKCPRTPRFTCQSWGAWRYLCALPQGARAACSSSCDSLFPRPDNIVSVQVGPGSGCCSFFFSLLFSPSRCNIPSGFSWELWNVSCSCQGPPEQSWALTGSTR